MRWWLIGSLMLVLNLPAHAALGADAVWTPPDGAIDRAHQEVANGKSPQEALAVAMKAGGAKPAALEFTRTLGEDAGYAGELSAQGPLTTGMLFFPLRANENAEPFVIDATGRLIRPGAADRAMLGEVAKHAGFAKLSPTGELDTWPPQEKVAVQPGAKGGTELVYEFRLKVCHGCPTDGVARVAYAFDSKGKYEGRRVLDVAPPPPEPTPSPSPAK